MRKEKFDEFMKQHQLEAASFMSIKQLDKRYSTFFNNLTIGFEAEISGGETLQNEDAVDEQAIREDYETFSLSNNDFLTNYIDRMSAVEVLDGFGIEAPYGIAGIEESNKFRNVINKINTVGFRVMGLRMEVRDPIMEAPSLGRYRSGNEYRKFVYEDSRLFNLQYVTNKALENQKIIEEFIKEMKFEPNNKVVTCEKLTTAPANITNAIFQMTQKSNLTPEQQARRWIYLCGQVIYNCIEALEIFRAITFTSGERDSETRILVKTESGGLKYIDVSKYDETYGINAPPLIWSDEARELFSEAHSQAESEAREDAIQSAIDDARMAINEDSSAVIERIYNFVVRDVDSNAKLSQGYHQIDNKKGKVTVVEGDSSISPVGAEVVSPVFKGSKKRFRLVI